MSTPTSPTGQSGPVVLTGVVPGYAVIPSSTPLTFLNYYDGKFLQASDLRQEQLAVQSMIQLSNRAAAAPGPGYGFDVTLGSGDTLTLGSGLGIDHQGRVLYLPQSVSVTVADLLASMQATGSSGTATAGAPGAASAAFQPCEIAVASPPGTPVSGTDLYLVTLSSAEGLCGSDEVFGRLCDAACVTATDRPWRIEGVLLGLVPLSLGQLATSSSVTLTQVHLRSQVAAAYYAAEAAASGSLVSAAGLASAVWCRGAAADTGSRGPAAVAGDAICLGVLARSDGTTVFFDEWTARRERIEATPQRYWAGRMAMRPWNEFLAQVLQFQCQLADVLGSGAAAGPVVNPLSQAMALLGRSATLLQEMQQAAPAEPAKPARKTRTAKAAAAAAAPAPAAPAGPALDQAIADYRQEVSDVLAGRADESAQILIDSGLIEIPSAGWLRIDPTSATALEAQVSQLLGPGVDLRFCVMRHDEAGFQFTHGQHLDRISLLAGLDDPSQVQQVDIFVPDGTWQAASLSAAAVAKPSIKPARDWVLFRRRSDVDCGSAPVPLDTVTVYVAPASSVVNAREEWDGVQVNKGQALKWTKVGDLQFNSGAASLVTPAATVQSAWNTAMQDVLGVAGGAARVYGAAYAPAANATDPVALGRASSLAAALPPAASSQTPGFAALTTAPVPLETGSTGALFVIAWPATVTVEVWFSSMPEPRAGEEWALITGTGDGKGADASWNSAGPAVLTQESPPKVVSWGGLAEGVSVGYAGYAPGSMVTGADGVQALLDRQTGSNLVDPIAVATNPPQPVGAGQDGSVFLITVETLG
jgi:hypothetical protein